MDRAARLLLAAKASAAFTFAIQAPSRRFGARPVLLTLSAVSAAGAILFLAAEKPWQVIAAAMLANLAVGAGETGPEDSGGHRRHRRGFRTAGGRANLIKKALFARGPGRPLFR